VRLSHLLEPQFALVRVPSIDADDVYQESARLGHVEKPAHGFGAAFSNIQTEALFPPVSIFPVTDTDFYSGGTTTSYVR
jgi:hypothetical protein